jgi:hypothetical protein
LDGAQHARLAALVKKKRRRNRVLRRNAGQGRGFLLVGRRNSRRKFIPQSGELLVTPSNLPRMKRPLFLSAAVFCMATSLIAQTPDAPPVDARQLLELLKQLRDQNESGIKSRRSTAYQQVAAAAASPERAVQLWKDAVRAVQFEGAVHEGAQLRDWKESDGEALNDRLCANAVRLHLNWMAISLQHSAGAEVKTLLPKIVEHVNSVQAAHDAAEQFAENLQKAKDRAPSSPGARKNVQEDSQVKRVHDQIMRMSISSSPVARWMQLGEMFGERKKGDGGWELGAGNVDGIYNSVILPEYRASKDPRLIEYWDMVLRREADRVAKRKLDVESRDWNTLKKPSILWNRAQDVLALGQRNRAIGEMFNVIKSNPQHPEAKQWIAQLETVLVPPAVPAAAPATPAAAPGTPAVPAVPAPAPIPSATTPGAVPTAGGTAPIAR